MKILLHGATNRGSTNYGDFIYGQKIYEYLTQKNHQVSFYQPSDYFCKYIKGYRKKEFGIKEADLVLYIPGGYFGESHHPTLKNNIIHFLRFMIVGLKGADKKIPIAVVGIGAGPINSPWFTFPIKRICRNTEFITTRDNTSTLALKELGIENVISTSDMILSMDISCDAIMTPQIEKILEKANSKKIAFVHYNHSSEAMDKFAEAINHFSKKHPDYFYVVGADSILPQENELYEEFKKICTANCVHYIYDSPFELTSLIEKSNIVLTCKLHVGVIATMMKKSVVCIAEHPEKTFRYYEQIKAKERFASLYDTSSLKIAEMMELYHSIPINIPQNVIELSKINWEQLDGLLK